MNDLAGIRPSSLPIMPGEAKKQIAITKAAIQYAAEMREWEKLYVAIDEMIDLQTKFIVWWNQTVGVRESPGRGGNKSNAERGSISAKEAKDQTGISQQQVSRWRTVLGATDIYRDILFKHEYRKAMAQKASGELVQQSLSNEHYTPAKYIEAARSVLGSIDIDPASCAEANKIVKARQFFDASNDGLSKDWSGNVWLNPPYGRLAGEFILKLCACFASGKVSASIALVNAHCTDTIWFQSLWDGLLCFTNHRINFYGDDSRSGSTHGSVFVYFGDKSASFIEHFQQFGPIVRKEPYG